MDTMKICPGCRKPLAPSAPDGLCPECLVKAGLPTDADIGPDSQAGSGQPAFAALPLEEVARLFPQLEVLGFIGQGGMGAVYQARQKELDRVVALKILPPDIGQDRTFAERFTREARALAKLNHSGIVTLYEFGKADGLFFFLMEFVDGVNLRQLLHAGRLSSREALAIVPQICDALQYAHDQGIVHRDIKPENILLDRQGRVKVADFGLAKLVGRRDDGALNADSSPATGPMLTEAGKVMGTPQYMAPEQRERPTEVDHRADIYSLGVVFYQMLTGELPAQRLEPPSRKVQVDVRLDEVVLRALEKEPERRYQQVSQVKTAVETIATTPMHAAAPPLISETAHGPSSALRRDLRSLVLTVLLHAATLLLAFVFFVFVVPRFGAELEGLGVQLPPATAVTLRFSRFLGQSWFVLIPVLLGFDVAICWLLQHLGGRRLLRWGSVPVIVALGLIVLLAALSLRLPGVGHVAGPGDGTRTPTGTLLARLPEGEIELVALSHHPSTNDSWWRPDGSPFPKSDWSRPDSKALPSAVANFKNPRQLVLRWEGAGEPPELLLRQVPDGGSGSASFWIYRDGVKVAGWEGIIHDFAPGQQTCTLRFAVASGPFQPLTDGLPRSSRGSVAERFPATGDFQGKPFTVGKFFERNGKPATTVTLDYFASIPRQRRIRVQDSLKRWYVGELVDTRSAAEGKEWQETYEFAGVSLPDLREAVLETRPSQWIEFRNVMLNPSKAGAVQPEEERSAAALQQLEALNAALAAGATIERVLDFEIRRATAYLDLDTGAYFDPGTNDMIWGLKATPPGVDLKASGIENNMSVRLAVNLAVLPVDATRWDASPDEIRKALASVQRQAEMRLDSRSPTNMFFFRTSEGGTGVMQLLPAKAGADISQVRVRYRLVSMHGKPLATEATASNPVVEPATRTFGPVTERTLTGSGAALLDLDTGQTLGPIALGKARLHPEMSVFLDLGPNAQGGTNLTLMAQSLYTVRTADWNIKSDDFGKVLTPQVVPTNTTVLATPEDRLPVTHWFRTGKGTVGVLQVLAFTEAPRGVRIRYRLFQPTAASQTPTASRGANEGALTNGWTRVCPIPSAIRDVKETSPAEGALKLWVEQGWLLAKRETTNRELEWQVVLARADTASSPPEVIASNAWLELRFGSHFLREDGGTLRIMREPKTPQSPAWPQPAPGQAWHYLGSGGNGGRNGRLCAWEGENWAWVAGGPENQRWDVWVRLLPFELKDPGCGFTGQQTLGKFFYGEANAQDDGSLFVAERLSLSAARSAVAARKLRQELQGAPAPALDGSQWLNTPAPLSWNDLRGKVVLLDFWGKWCGPCVKRLPEAEALYAKFKHQNLVVLGVHSQNDSAKLAAFLAEKKITFPTVVDTGQTAPRYGIELWPTYFLVDRTGKVIWGFSNEPPKESQILELLRE